MMKLTSDCVGPQSFESADGTAGSGTSVVPASAWPSHGSTNSTRPSVVSGINMPFVGDANQPGRTMWTPVDGRMTGLDGGCDAEVASRGSEVV